MILHILNNGRQTVEPLLYQILQGSSIRTERFFWRNLVVVEEVQHGLQGFGMGLEEPSRKPLKPLCRLFFETDVSKCFG